MKLAVILHAFYPELRGELDSCIANLDEPYDLFVTDGSGGNRGFDIWPFLRTLDTLDLTKYTHVLKLHTKRDVKRPVGFNGFEVAGPTWRNWLLSIVSSRDAWQRTKSRLEEDETIGMVAAAECILDRKATEGREERMVFDTALRDAVRRFGVPERALAAANYVGGTMFLARSEALRPLQGRFTEGEFAVSGDSHLSDSFAHVAERLIGFSASAAGLRIECPEGNLRSRRREFRRRQRLNAVGDFFFQSRITSHGRHLVKVCRIPVWNCRIK